MSSPSSVFLHYFAAYQLSGRELFGTENSSRPEKKKKKFLFQKSKSRFLYDLLFFNSREIAHKKFVLSTRKSMRTFLNASVK